MPPALKTDSLPLSHWGNTQICGENSIVLVVKYLCIWRLALEEDYLV